MVVSGGGSVRGEHVHQGGNDRLSMQSHDTYWTLFGNNRNQFPVGDATDECQRPPTWFRRAARRASPRSVRVVSSTCAAAVDSSSSAVSGWLADQNDESRAQLFPIVDVGDMMAGRRGHGDK